MKNCIPLPLLLNTRVQEMTDIKSSFLNDINAKLTDLSEKFNDFNLQSSKVYSELQQFKPLMPGGNKKATHT